MKEKRKTEEKETTTVDGDYSDSVSETLKRKKVRSSWKK